MGRVSALVRRLLVLGLPLLVLGCGDDSSALDSKTRGTSPTDAPQGNSAGVEPASQDSQNGSAALDGPPCQDEQASPRLLRLLTREEYANTISELLQIANPDLSALPGESALSGYTTDAVNNVVSSTHATAYFDVAAQLATQATSGAKPAVLPCATKDATCIDSFLTKFGRRAFRRPLTTEEMTRFRALFRDELTGGSVVEGARLVIWAMLASPAFLYRSEVGEPDGDSFRLTSYEMASALSYTLLGTLPDAELSAAADKDALTSADQVAAQIRRLLSLPRARTRASKFMVQWLGTATLGGQKSAELYPTFNDDVRNALRAEEKSFAEYIFFDASNPSEELYRSKYVFANGTLAKHYGIDGVTSPVPQRVPAAGTNRRGVLTLGSVLASYAKADITAPVQRGAFVRKRLLCQDVPPPVPGASSQLPGLGGAIATTRQRFESHSTNPDCSGCHKLIDQVGFAFEKFDATGAFRLQEAGRPIDDSGLLANIRMGGTAKDVPLQGMESLAETLATSETAPACFASQIYRYTRGFKPGAADVCAERKLQQGIRAGNARDLLVNLLTQPSFRNRRTTGGSKP